MLYLRSNRTISSTIRASAQSTLSRVPTSPRVKTLMEKLLGENPPQGEGGAARCRGGARGRSAGGGGGGGVAGPPPPKGPLNAPLFLGKPRPGRLQPLAV